MDQFSSVKMTQVKTWSLLERQVAPESAKEKTWLLRMMPIKLSTPEDTSKYHNTRNTSIPHYVHHYIHENNWVNYQVGH